MPSPKKNTRNVTAYHYTSIHHLPYILRDGFLKTTESNLSMRKEHVGPDVVWLSRHDDLHVRRDSGLQFGPVDKYEIRFKLSLPDRETWKWYDWARMRGSSEDTIRILAETAKGGASAWLVIERPIILLRECREIFNTVTGEPIQWPTK